MMAAVRNSDRLPVHPKASSRGFRGDGGSSMAAADMEVTAEDIQGMLIAVALW
jgi:hypothetical protein